MIEEQARVIAVNGKRIEVMAQRHSACGSCAAKSGCGTSVLAAWFPQRALTFSLENTVGAGLGETVVVGLDERALQRAALLLYALPLAGLLLGAVLGDLAWSGSGGSGELGAVVLGLLGLFLAFMALRLEIFPSLFASAQGVQLLRVVRGSVSVPLGAGLSKSDRGDIHQCTAKR